MRFASLFAGFAFALSLPLAACAPDSGGGLREEADVVEGDAALAVPFEVLDIRKNAADPGLTVIKNKAQFLQFFGVAAPASINFNKSWVVHYSSGVQNTGGYAANIIAVERTGTGANRKVTVFTEDVSPGPSCFVTQALTNPQTTVKIAKQTGIPVERDAQFTETDCSQPDFCLTALCPAGTQCNEPTDSCIEEQFCPKVKCANGYECDEAADACVPRACDPNVADTCPAGFACENHLACITAPCPADYRCWPAPADPCQGIDYAGTCDGNTLKYCQDATLVELSCTEYDATCQYNAAQSYYDCL